MKKSYSNKLRKSINNRRYKQTNRKKYRKKNNRRYNKLSKNTKYLGGGFTVPTEEGVGSIANAFKVYLEGIGNELEEVNIRPLSSNTGKSGSEQYSAKSGGTSLFIKYIPKGLFNKGIFEFTKHMELSQILTPNLQRARTEAAGQQKSTLKILLENSKILSKRYIPIIDIAWVLQYKKGNWIVVKADEKADSSGLRMVEKRMPGAKIMGIALIQLNVMYPKRNVEPLHSDIQKFMENLLEEPDDLNKTLSPETRMKVHRNMLLRKDGNRRRQLLSMFLENSENLLKQLQLLAEMTDQTQLLFIDGKGTPASLSYLKGDRFREGEIFLGCMGAKLDIDMNKITRDVSFLKQHDIMDYSLNMSVTCEGLHVNSNIVPVSDVDNLSDIFKKTIIVALKSIQILKPEDSASCLRIFNEVMKSMKSLFPEDFDRLSQEYKAVLENISVELWDTKYSAILNILGLPTPFMDKEYRKLLEDAMNNVLNKPHLTVINLPLPSGKSVHMKGSTTGSTTGFTTGSTTGSTTGFTTDSINLIIDLQNLGSLPILPTQNKSGQFKAQIPKEMTPARIFKERFLSKIPHLEIEFKPGESSGGYKLSLIDVSLSRTGHADFIKYLESKIKWWKRTPGMERAGCKNLMVKTENGIILPINNNCNPCSFSVCKAVDYANRFLNWVYKISIPNIPGITTPPAVSRPTGGGQRRLTKQKKINRRNKTRKNKNKH